MTKDEAIKWMVEEGLAENEFSASHIYGVPGDETQGLCLWKFSDAKQRELVRQYRKWRTLSRNTKLCFAYTLADVKFPKEYEGINEPKRSVEQNLKELGYE